MKSLFGNKLGGVKSERTASVELVTKLVGQIAGKATFVDSKVATSAIAMEGYSESATPDIEQAVSSLQALIKQSIHGIREARAEAVERAIWHINYFGLYCPKPYLWGTQG